MFEEFNAVWKKYIQRTAHVVIAVSGGRDSMALLDLILRTRHPHAHLHIVHFNHQLRAASPAEARLVTQFARHHKVGIDIVKLAVTDYCRKHKLNLEAGARTLRYFHLEKFRQRYHASFILTAHHADDQLETRLLNLVRGAFLEGWQGMKVVDNYLFRPLLTVSRTQLEAYVQNRQLPFCEDESNTDVRYARNRLRHHVLPELKKINANLAQTLERTAELATLVQKEIDHLLPATPLSTCSKSEIEALSPFVRWTYWRHLYQELYGSVENWSLALAQEIDRFMVPHRPHKKHRFGSRYWLISTRTGWTISE